MATDVVMPRLSDSMEEGTVLRWLKSVGDEVKRGDELVEIETDKANMTYEATDEGTLVEILADEGATLPIGEPIARIGDPSDEKKPSAGKPADGSEAGRAQREPEEPAREPQAQQTAERPQPAPSGNGRVKASPVARRMARDLNVQLDSIQGSGPGGRIVKADVEAAAGGEKPSAGKPADGSAKGRSPNVYSILLR
jgi:pyruvate dehydrogenase E2 component (dihydrolipoyllysine-residue acetyltransferase)